MKSATSQIRKIQTEIDRQEACRRQIAKLERELDEAREAVRAGTETLILTLAEERGISSLAPNEIVALFETLRLPVKEGAASDAKDDGNPLAGTEPTASGVAVAVRFGNHKGGKTALLKAIGLTRNGKLRNWHGRVDRATLTRLQEIFGNKVTILTIHPESTPAAAVVDSTISDPRTAEGLDHSGGDAGGAAVPSDIDLHGPNLGSDRTAAAADALEAVDQVAGPDSAPSASTPTPRRSFTALPRLPALPRQS